MFKKYSRLNERGLSTGGGFLLWLLGVPLPLILLISLIRGCN